MLEPKKDQKHAARQKQAQAGKTSSDLTYLRGVGAVWIEHRNANTLLLGPKIMAKENRSWGWDRKTIRARQVT